MLATVLTGRNNIFTVDSPAGRLLCRIKGKTLELEEREYNPLAPGDEVVVSSVDSDNGTAVIDKRKDRRSAFSRFNRKRDTVQTLAANIECVAAVSSISRPSFKDRFVDRVLALAEFHGVDTLLILSKSDLGGESDSIRSRYEPLVGAVITCSAADGNGMPLLLESLRGRRTVLVGPSGVGKSTLVNALLGEQEQAVGTTDRFHRGRHTTSAGRLLHGDGFELIDTPGVRELDCRHIPSEELPFCFREFRDHLGGCRLDDCTHRSEPECAVIGAVGTHIHPRRYESYLRLRNEIEELLEAT